MIPATSNFFICFCWLSSLICTGQLSSGNVVHSLVQRRKPLPGAAIKLQEINIAAERARSTQDAQEDIDVDNFAGTILKRSRRSINPDFSPKITRMHLNDSHNMAYVHWSGDNRETVVVLTRDRTITASSNSAVWISRDYAQTFQNYTTQFTFTSGSVAQISRFYASPVDKTKYIFVDRRHKYVFTTTDDCRTFKKKAVSFTPDDITFHDSYPSVVLAYDKTAYIKRLYVSQDFGLTWSLKDERVKSYYWGIPPYENYNTLYIEREELTGGTSVIVKTDYFTNRAVSLISGVNDFEVLDGFMFATKSGGRNNLTLMVSVNRSTFHAAQIPTNLPKLDYLVSDVSENQVFLAVSHSVRTTHLYISDASGLKYSLSLPRVLYFSVKTGSPWLRRYIDHSFVDLHKVDSLRGVYIASQLSKGAVGRRHIMSYITYDKGGEWRLISAPKVDMNNKLLNCSLPNCSLHVSQEFGKHYPYSRYTPMLSSPAAPGIVMAMGTIGTNLKLNADVFLSTNGGLTWNAVLKGSYYYNMGDHGGIIIAVPRGAPTNLIYYSWNEGEHWLTTKFLDNDRIYVYGLLTEPGEKNTKFTIFGSHTKKHEWVVVHIDLRKALGNPCSLSQDYKDWIPSDEYNSSCLLGRKSIYRRRIAHARCYNGYNFDRPITVQNCPCTRDDFECDVGYQVVQGVSCTWDTTSGLTPTPIPTYCPAGSTYLKSKGYRKVVGDTCSGGKEGDYKPSTVVCPISSLPEFLLFAQRKSIKRITLGSHQETTLPLPGLQQTIALDFDYKENCVYWSDIHLNTIKRAFLNGSGIIQTLHSSMQQVEGIALDWLGNNIYWVDAGAKKIEVSRIDGHYRKVLYPNNHDKPRALVVHPMKGYMYWTDWGTQAKIMKAHLSGSHSYAMINSSLKWPNGITIDFTDNKLYWTDAWWGRIEKSDLDGKNRQVITHVGLPHPYSIAIYKQFMYWDDWNTQNIMRAFKSGGSFRTVIQRGLLGIMDLKIFHKDIQLGTNKCSSPSPCTYLCLASPVPPLYKCACPDNMLTSISPSGNITCTCQNHTILVNGDCQTTSGTCPPTKFKCDNNQCIPLSWKCDHEDDCGDGSDEKGPCPYATCRPTEFRCPSGLCIRRSWVCDHDNDCGDMSDERNCTFPTCRSDQYTCDNHRCISRRWVCDSDNDCRDNSDEQHCPPVTPTTPAPTNCSSSEFACHNGRCIPRSWYCDNDNDCGDYSDEPTACHRSQTCTADQFTCQNGRCISKRWHCDKDNDCGDYSDEIGCHYNVTTTVAPTTVMSTTPKVCNSWEFKCDNGRCISRGDCGDNVNDCGDNSDETKCVPLTTKKPDHSSKRPCHFYEFTCNNGFCILNSQHCDNTNNCGDWSDEIGCTAKPPVTTTPKPTTAPHSLCISPFVQCNYSKFCILPSSRCDGTLNCPDGSDEMNCPTHTYSTTTRVTTPTPTCSPDQFPCRNGQCVPGNSYCDNKKQCTDGSDEKGCGGTAYSPWTCFSRGDGVLICDKNTLCLQWTKRCDSFGTCRDGSDERDCDVSKEDMKARTLRTTNDNTTLNFMWSPSKYQPKWMSVIGYRVKYRIYNQNGWTNKPWKFIDIQNTTRSSLELPQLKPCKEYEFNVRIVWSKLVGPFTDPIKDHTPIVLIGPPGNVSATPMKNGSITVSWTKPKIVCYGITGYKVTYIAIDSKVTKTKWTGNVVSTTIKGLDPSMSYSITVQGYKKKTNPGYQSQALFVVPEPEAQNSARKASKMIWAIPVGIVASLFFIGVVILLVYFVRKSRRLQGSMYALLRTNGHETGGEVTFHSDDDDPMIRGFADDVPLVTA